MVTVDGFDVLARELDEHPAAELVRASGTVEALREVKDAGEIALLRLACEAADAALAELVERRRPAARAHRTGGRPASSRR